MAKSRISEEKKCILCGSVTGLHRHHIFYGTANRKKSEEWGMVVYLCALCHMNLHHYGYYDKDLKELAQKVFEAQCGTREDFRKEFGKSWL